MKGVSSVIATILMLMITIALAGMAYTYISGLFRTRTAVVLSVADAQCTTGGVTVYVRNDGTATSSTVTVSRDDGAASCTITSIAAGQEGTCKIGTASPGAGYHTLRAVATGSTTTGSVYCAS